MRSFTCNRTGDTASVSIFGEMLHVARPLIEQIGDAPKVELRINSPGGCSCEGLELHDALSGRDVTVEISGKCYSAAVTVATSGRRIRINHDAKMMLHRPVRFVMGDSDDLRSSARHLDKTGSRIIEIVAARTRQPMHVVERWFGPGVDTCFAASEALALGLVDEVLPPAVEKPRRKRGTSEAATDSPPPFTDGETLLFDFLTRPRAAPGCRQGPALSRAGGLVHSRSTRRKNTT